MALSSPAPTSPTTRLPATTGPTNWRRRPGLQCAQSRRDTPAVAKKEASHPQPRHARNGRGPGVRRRASDVPPAAASVKAVAGPSLLVSMRWAAPGVDSRAVNALLLFVGGA